LPESNRLPSSRAPEGHPGGDGGAQARELRSAGLTAGNWRPKIASRLAFPRRARERPSTTAGRELREGRLLEAHPISTPIPERKARLKDCDVIVIGGGINGMTSAGPNPGRRRE
jgi:hypothetical protein